MTNFINSGNESTEFYRSRCEQREITMANATLNFIQYFISLGDDDVTAKNKVSQLSTEIAPFIYVYVLGNTQPLINSINNSILPFMDDAAKLKIIGDLTI